MNMLIIFPLIIYFGKRLGRSSKAFIVISIHAPKGAFHEKHSFSIH